MSTWKILRVRRQGQPLTRIGTDHVLAANIEAANPAEAFRKFRDLSPTMASVPLTDLEAMETP
jgi:hypothetical protein